MDNLFFPSEELLKIMAPGLWDALNPDQGPASLAPEEMAALRQDARSELEPLFKIGKPGKGAAENVLGAEDFDALLTDYLAVREGWTDLRIDTSEIGPALGPAAAVAYEDMALTDIRSILQTEGGRELIRSLAYDPEDQTTTLRPAWKRNANQQFDPSLGIDPRQAFAWGGGANMNEGSLRPDGTAGRGIDTEVRYNPGQTTTRAGVLDKWMPMRSDVTLYHELVHALDLVSGTMPSGELDAHDGVTPVDEAADTLRREYAAVGLGAWSDRETSENEYREARRAIGKSGVGVREGDKKQVERNNYANTWY